MCFPSFLSASSAAQPATKGGSLRKGRSSAFCLPAAPQEPDDPCGYNDKHGVLDDRCVLLHHGPLIAQRPPEADQCSVPEAIAYSGVESELPDWHPLDPRWQRDEITYTREEHTDQDGFPTVPIKCLTRLVEIRLAYEGESANPYDESV